MPEDTDGTTDVNVEAVRAFFRFMHDKDIDAWADLWADDGHIVVPYPAAGFATRIEGRAEIVAGFRRLFANFDTFDYDIRALHRTQDPDVIVVEWHVSARVSSTGYHYESDPITVFVLRAGQIVEYRDYFDPQKFGIVVAALPEE